MKKTLICLMLMVLSLAGCSQKTAEPVYVELTKEMFEGMNISSIDSIGVVIAPFGMEDKPETWSPAYRKIFPTKDPAQIKIIYDCIKAGDTIDLRFTLKRFLFKIKGADTVYYTGFDMTNKEAAGYWWISTELRQKLKDWGLEEPKVPQKNAHPPYIELTKESFMNLDVSSINSVALVSVPFKTEDEPDKWEFAYKNIFPISDPEKIKIIYSCIRKGDPIDRKFAFDRILFKTKNAVYYTGYDMTDKESVGYWWSVRLQQK